MSESEKERRQREAGEAWLKQHGIDPSSGARLPQGNPAPDATGTQPTKEEPWDKERNIREYMERLYAPVDNRPSPYWHPDRIKMLKEKEAEKKR